MTERAPRTARRLANDPCPIDQATLERGVQAIERLADAADGLKEAAAAVVYLKEAEEKLCGWFKERGPKIKTKAMWFIVLTSLVYGGASGVSPEVTTRLVNAALTTLGL